MAALTERGRRELASVENIEDVQDIFALPAIWKSARTYRHLLAWSDQKELSQWVEKGQSAG